MIETTSTLLLLLGLLAGLVLLVLGILLPCFVYGIWARMRSIDRNLAHCANYLRQLAGYSPRD